MNTYTLAVAAMAAILATSSVHAEENSPQLYAGMDIGIMSADYKTSNGLDYSEVFDDRFTAYNPYVGVDMNDKLAFELGYLQTSSSSKDLGTVNVAGVGTVSGDTNLKVKGFHFDVVGKHALTEKVELQGALGLARLKADATLNVSGAASGSVQEDESDTGVRVGLGARYAVTDQFGVRGMLRYTKVDFADTADSLMQYSVGVNYKF